MADQAWPPAAEIPPNKENEAQIARLKAQYLMLRRQQQQRLIAFLAVLIVMCVGPEIAAPNYIGAHVAFYIWPPVITCISYSFYAARRESEIRKLQREIDERRNAG